MNCIREAGINLAYEFVLPSYGWAIQRLDASRARSQALLTYAASLTFAAPVVIKALDPTADLSSGWFIAALVLFALIGAGGIGFELWWRRRPLMLISPSRLTGDDWLLLSDEAFKLQMVKAAGKDMDHNASLINARANVNDVLTLLFILEVGCLGLWANQVL